VFYGVTIAGKKKPTNAFIIGTNTACAVQLTLSLVTINHYADEQ
jgi:hypothetical protein